MKRIYMIATILLLGVFHVAAQVPSETVKAGEQIYKAVTSYQLPLLQKNLLGDWYNLPGGIEYVPVSLSIPTPQEIQLRFNPENANPNSSDLWRIPLSKQIKLASLTQVPGNISHIISPSLTRIYLPNHQKLLANGFILHYADTNWVALSFHVGGKEGNERIVKLRLKDNTEVSFVGMVEKAGNSGYHEADISLIRIPEQWQDQVIALDVIPLHTNAPLYSFGFVAPESQHDDFIPIQRHLLAKDGLTLHMTHALPGASPTEPLGLSGYCGSPIVQEINGKIGVVGIFAGLVDPVAAQQLPVSYAIDLNDVLPVIVYDNTTLRNVNFLGKTITQIPYTVRLEDMTLMRDGKALFTRDLHHFPYRFSHEETERAFIGAEFHSNDIVIFKFRGRNGSYEIEYTIP
ncbi:hypothetical protein [Candidatus Avelusimicrobium luingense]|uniref:hypothetical protein n=1 Tax=Candidatus Avelusimicrobium luingense TaxID=3416211 RepID=UPI003D11CC99